MSEVRCQVPLNIVSTATLNVKSFNTLSLSPPSRVTLVEIFRAAQFDPGGAGAGIKLK